MKKAYKIIVVIIWVLVVGLFFGAWHMASAADILVSWNTSQGATGYILEASTDNGATWSTKKDVGQITPKTYTSGSETLSLCSYTWTGLPDTGLVLIRVKAYNDYGTTTNTRAGSWFNKAWQAPAEAKGVGIQ